MAFAAKMPHQIRILGAALVLALSLPGMSLGETTGNCSQDPDNPPARGQSGSVSVTTTPEKAVVYLGGQKLGPSPIDTVFPSGRHSLTIMLNGEELVKERVNICAGEKTSIIKELKLPYGSVAVKTTPLNMNARVTVDGEVVGSTRGGVLTINRLEAGTRAFKVSNGKRHKEISVNVLPEETVELNVDFRSK
ncbi:MAG: PEGA domain-containing protein [Fibrobacteria bacterium]